MFLPHATAQRAIWRSACSHGGTHTSIWYIGSKRTTCVGVSPLAASHSFFSSSVHILSVVIGVHCCRVAIAHLAPSRLSASPGEGLSDTPPTRGSCDPDIVLPQRVYDAWDALDLARSLQLRRGLRGSGSTTAGATFPSLGGSKRRGYHWQFPSFGAGSERRSRGERAHRDIC